MFLFSSCAVRLHSNSSPRWRPAAWTANDTVSSFKWFQRAFDERIRDIRTETQRPFCSLSQKTQNKTPNTHTHTQRTCLDRIIILYLLLTSPFHTSDLCVLPLSSPLASSRCDTGCGRYGDTQSDADSGLIFFFLLPFSVSKERPTPPEAPSSKYRTQRQEQGDILFSDFITPRTLGVYSNSLSPDMHGEGCDYAPLSRSALI